MRSINQEKIEANIYLRRIGTFDAAILAEVYRGKVADPIAALPRDDGAEARELARSLVEPVTSHPDEFGQPVEVRGELAAIPGLASGDVS